MAFCLVSMYAEAKYGGGNGTVSDPYQIWTAEQMNAIGANSGGPGRHFKLMADIDLSGFTGTEFNIIGAAKETPFTGTFDGNNHTISNFSYNGTGEDNVGVFGSIMGDGTIIKDLKLIGANINASSRDGVGSLVGGLAKGAITNCHALQCTVSGRGRAVGGLVGLNGRLATVSSSYAECNVFSDRLAGGLVGESYGTVSDSYATGDVSASRSAGGLAGKNRSQGTLIRCYSLGRVNATDYAGALVGENDGTIADCFWDRRTCGKFNMCGEQGRYGTGCTSDGRKDTAGMQTASTFTSAGWDFVGETENGTEDTWCICEGADYPKLTWQFVVGDFDGDGDTDFADFCILAVHWLGTDSSLFCGGTDLTNDGSTDISDLSKFAENWLAER
jgi:hypothetical protein